MKSRNPSALSNSAESALAGRRAAALPNNPNCIGALPRLTYREITVCEVMFKIPDAYRVDNGRVCRPTGFFASLHACAALAENAPATYI
jgi:hypothetical protein